MVPLAPPLEKGPRRLDLSTDRANAFFGLNLSNTELKIADLKLIDTPKYKLKKLDTKQQVANIIA